MANPLIVAPLRRLPLTNLAFHCHPSISFQILCCQPMRFTALVHSLLRYHTEDISWLAALGTSYLLRNSIEVLLYSECDKILMVHLRSIINDEFSMSLLPMRVPRHEGRIIEAISVSVRPRLRPRKSPVAFLKTHSSGRSFCSQSGMMNACQLSGRS